MQTKTSLQDLILNKLRQEKQQVTLFLTNGFQLKGRICAFDSFVIAIESDEKQQVIYKHAISTIVPSHPVPLMPNDKMMEIDTVFQKSCMES